MPRHILSHPKQKDDDEVSIGSSSSNHSGKIKHFQEKIGHGVKRQLKKLDDAYHHLTHTEHRHSHKDNSHSPPQSLKSFSTGHSSTSSTSDSGSLLHPEPSPAIIPPTIMIETTEPLVLLPPSSPADTTVPPSNIPAKPINPTQSLPSAPLNVEVLITPPSRDLEPPFTTPADPKAVVKIPQPPSTNLTGNEIRPTSGGIPGDIKSGSDISSPAPPSPPSLTSNEPPRELLGNLPPGSSQSSPTITDTQTQSISQAESGPLPPVQTSSSSTSSKNDPPGSPSCSGEDWEQLSNGPPSMLIVSAATSPVSAPSNENPVDDPEPFELIKTSASLNDLLKSSGILTKPEPLEDAKVPHSNTVSQGDVIDPIPIVNRPSVEDIPKYTLTPSLKEQEPIIKPSPKPSPDEHEEPLLPGRYLPVMEPGERKRLPNIHYFLFPNILLWCLSIGKIVYNVLF